MTGLQEVDYVSIHWDRSQLNPIYSHDIVIFILSLGSASTLGNNNHTHTGIQLYYTVMIHFSNVGTLLCTKETLYKPMKIFCQQNFFSKIFSFTTGPNKIF